ncbi:exported hypothetical protein [Azospirillaceae bacterium]
MWRAKNLPVWGKALFALAASGALSGCFWETVGAGAGAVTLGSLSATKKLPTDHLLSMATGRECSIVTFEQTGHYCPPNITVDRSGVYCYRTLGEVDCHQLPDPYQNGQSQLASPPPVRVER